MKSEARKSRRTKRDAAANTRPDAVALSRQPWWARSTGRERGAGTLAALRIWSCSEKSMADPWRGADLARTLIFISQSRNRADQLDSELGEVIMRFAKSNIPRRGGEVQCVRSCFATVSCLLAPLTDDITRIQGARITASSKFSFTRDGFAALRKVAKIRSVGRATFLRDTKYGRGGWRHPFRCRCGDSSYRPKVRSSSSSLRALKSIANT